MRILGIALGLSLFTAACADPVPPVAPTPVSPTITENFQGTLLVLGANSHPFSVAQVGGLTVTINDITPSASLSLGVGAAGLTGCGVIRTVTVNGTTGQISGTAAAPGNFCVSVSDTGTLTEPVTYTVTVQHS